MADTNNTIAASGADYTTLAAWEADADVSSGRYIGTITDSGTYAAVVIDGATGTESITNYVYLLTDSANRAATPAWDDSKAKIVNTSGGTHCILVKDNFVRLQYLQIHQDSTSGSDEGIRLDNSSDDALISRCIIKHDNNTADTDGIYTGNWQTSASIDNCVIYGFRRAGIHIQNFTGSQTQTINIDYCTIYDCGASGEAESGGINVRRGSTAVVNVNCYNTGCFDTQSTYEDFSFSGNDGTWAGTNNACTDTSLTSRGIATNAQESLTTTDTTQSSGSYAVFTDLTGGSEDFNLLDAAAGNLLYGNGVSRVGSEPDVRQDFSLDFAGNARSTTSPAPDIGADEFIAPVTGEPVTAYFPNIQRNVRSTA